MTCIKSLLLATTAIVGSLAAAQADPVTFAPVPVPETDAAMRAVVASESITIGDTTQPIGYHVLARSGDDIGGTVFGTLTDENGDPVMNADGSTAVSVSADFSSLLPVGDKLYSISHFEARPGAMYISELTQDDATGMLTPVSTRPVDFSALGGLWVPCAGSVTPWGTHLGSEEYEPDARQVAGAGVLDDIDDDFKPMARYFGLDPATMTLDDFRGVFNPYAYGFPVEVTVSEDGSATPVKHTAMGRLAVELAYVMPDRRTAYISDDGTNVGLFMFVADEAGKLDAGTLYALKWHQTSNAGAGAADIGWINLGHASSDEVAAIIDRKPSFDDIFVSAAPNDDGSCGDGLRSVNTSVGQECLAVKPGMEIAASRLETRRYAAIRGATTELRKEEGITFDPDSSTLYVAMSEVARGMAAGTRYDTGGNDDVRLAENKCGAVYGMTVAPDASIGSDYVVASAAAVIAGSPTSYFDASRYAGNACQIDGIANPDNLTFLTGSGTLIIGEDTGLGHRNDAIWAYDVAADKLTRILTTPYGSETTSPYFYPDVNGWAYIMAVVQHPYGESDRGKLADPADAAAYVGYIGPFRAE